jgi:hypothetical protein
MQDLIGFIQNHPRSKREDLAGEVLALLLREEPGQTVLRTLTLNYQEPAIEVITQRSTAGCIPDIHLVQDGKTVALLELKFWAGLTAHQVSGKYFEVASQVLFIVPEERLTSLQNELSALMAVQSLVLLSWKDLLGRLEGAKGPSETRDNRLFAAALYQLKEFCNVIEQEHYVPFTAEQLRMPVQDLLTQHCLWLTRESIASATKAELIKEAGRLQAGLDSFFFYGQNVILGGFRVWLGYWPYAWEKSPTNGPFWIQFHGPDATRLRQSNSFKDGISMMDNDLAFPLLKQSAGPHSTQEDEVSSITQAVLTLLERLNAHKLQAQPPSLA